MNRHRDLSARTSLTALGCAISLTLGACSQQSAPESATAPSMSSVSARVPLPNTASAGATATATATDPAARPSSAATAGNTAPSAATAGAVAVATPNAATSSAAATGPAANDGASGAAAVGGNAGAAGGGAAMQPTTAAQCAGGAQQNLTPFGCKLAWGTNDSGASLAELAGLTFVTKWVGYELDKAGNLPRCDGCSWLTQQVQSTALIPVYYAYFIGFFGKANGLPDGNENPSGPNLTTDAAKLIRSQRAGLLNAYSSYAKQTAAVWHDKPLVWLLEGDFVQYTSDSQKEKLSYAELGELARDISCAIKSQMPNAVVAINHSTWNSDQVTNDFWAAMKGASYDLVWTTGVANNQGFIEMGADANKYNAKTATYTYLHTLTGRNLFVDTSFGLSEMGDSWSGADPATLNARIAEGVIAANVTKPPMGYVAKVMGLADKLTPVCKQ